MVGVHGEKAMTTDTQNNDTTPKSRKPAKRKPAASQEPAVALGGAQGDAPPTAKPGARRAPRRKEGATQAATLAELAERYLEHLEAEDRSHGTLFSYGIELRTACKELGGDTPLASLTPEQVAAYYDSPRVTRLKSGKPKAKPSVDKTRRVLRLALVWAAEQAWLATAPIPETTEPSDQGK
jgi:hypothetical protein